MAPYNSDGIGGKITERFEKIRYLANAIRTSYEEELETPRIRTYHQFSLRLNEDLNQISTFSTAKLEGILEDYDTLFERGNLFSRMFIKTLDYFFADPRIDKCRKVLAERKNALNNLLEEAKSNPYYK